VDLLYIPANPTFGNCPRQVERQFSYRSIAESANGQDLFFLATPDFALWRLPLAGGPETTEFAGFVAEGGSSYAPVKNGIYFIRAAEHSPKQELSFFSFATRRMKTLAGISGALRLGLAVLPDERLILYGQTDAFDSELMLIDPFH
jgi:hypothetical protein